MKERNQTEKVKGKKKGGKPAQAATRRVMTAKLKKELAQRKRDGGRPTAEIPRSDFTGSTGTTATGSASADSSTEAVEQVEQTAQAAAVDMGRAAKRGAAMAVSKVKQKRREIKERRRQPDTQGQPPDTPAPAPGIHGTDTPPASDARHGRTADGATTPPPPTPEERMRQQAAEQRKEQCTHPRIGTTFQGEAPASPHYGGPPPAPGPATQNSPTGVRSINPSIKERPRRSTVLKEKPQAGAVRPKTRQAVEQAARARAAPASTSGPAGKKAAAKVFTDRARKKARRDAQRGMLQKSKQTAQAAADLSKKAAQATVKAVKELISALAALVGGGVLAAAMCVIFLVAAVIASPL